MSDNKCPVCGSKDLVTVSTRDPYGYTHLVYSGHGCIHYLLACVDCGVVFLPDEVRAEIMKGRNKKK